ncbi:carboxymuconolactone decarboxylase family protein [Derxia gummosa]|uniref:Carboxymuconolactone decarboxylase family protein n=1 Tax=Derxia gummosa DSM 723 TaxID=1121388 RepID=A0A8B6X7B0_9BURK|nr:carboxymuconolactone decarboxylase family protein [Derxia gummosa]
MTRISTLARTDATGSAADLLDAVNNAFGTIPNLFLVTARAPAVLQGLLQFNAALSGGVLAAREREAIAIAVAEVNGCDYCLSAHLMIGKGAGLADGELALARQGKAADGRLDAILRLATTLVQTRGIASDEQIAAARAAGLGDAELLEVVGVVALNVLTNYLNLVAGTPIDFPVVRSSRSHG